MLVQELRGDNDVAKLLQEFRVIRASQSRVDRLLEPESVINLREQISRKEPYRERVMKGSSCSIRAYTEA